METRIHPETGAMLKRDIRPQVIQYGIYRMVVDTPGWYPDEGNDGIHEMNDLDQNEATFVNLRSAYIAHLKDFRDRLNLTQEAASDLIGGGPRAFQKYESGRGQPTSAAIKLIEVLYERPDVLRILAKVNAGCEPIAA
ncbi:type II toxin-antitoxin system MqsA family antitoxin [Novosphingobium sp.]|uniref:type II toxin-antitoxin system MqsA family antitoxin n=1 Tax=Novosphingobium sp. TaxID=1874826 RepID=UPI003B525187